MEARLESGHFWRCHWGFCGRGGRVPLTLRPDASLPGRSAAPSTKYKHSLCAPWWSQGCRETRSGSSSWHLGSPDAAGRHELAHSRDPLSSSLPLFLGWPAAWPSCVCSWQVPPEGPVFWGGCTPHFTVDSLGLSFHSLQRHFYLENT